MSAARENEASPVYLGLGSNIDPEVHLPKALAYLSQHLEIVDSSSIWETPPVGGSGPNFLNAVVLFYINMDQESLREELLRPVETALGRVRSSDPNAPRTIDLDILIYDGNVLEPEIWTQAHWAVPLAELAPGCQNPETGETVQQAAHRLSRTSEIIQRRDVLI